MPLKIPNEGEIELLKLIIAGGGGWRVKLFKNNYWPTDTDSVGNYTEADFSGYAGGLTPAGWSVPSNQFGMAQSSATPLVYQNDGGGVANDIFGYFVVNAGNTKLLWAERFPMPVTLAADGDRITLTPSLMFSSMF
jgi:hypothetical protein